MFHCRRNQLTVSDLERVMHNYNIDVGFDVTIESRNYLGIIMDLLSALSQQKEGSRKSKLKIPLSLYRMC